MFNTTGCGDVSLCSPPLLCHPPGVLWSNQEKPMESRSNSSLVSQVMLTSCEKKAQEGLDNGRFDTTKNHCLMPTASLVGVHHSSYNPNLIRAIRVIRGANSILNGLFQKKEPGNLAGSRICLIFAPQLRRVARVTDWAGLEIR